MRRDLVEVEEVDRIAAREFLQDVLNEKFDRARVKSRFDNDIAAEAEELSSFLVGSDTRTFAILAVSFLEDTLKLNFVEKWSVEKQKQHDAFFGSNGPLSTFSQRTLIACALSWWPENLMREIDALRRIRNELAHNHRVHSLLEEPLLSWASSLEERERAWDIDKAPYYKEAYARSDKETKLRMRIGCCVFGAVGLLLARSKLIEHDVPPGYREKGYDGLLKVEQDLIETTIKYCFRCLKIDKSGLTRADA